MPCPHEYVDCLRYASHCWRNAIKAAKHQATSNMKKAHSAMIYALIASKPDPNAIMVRYFEFLLSTTFLVSNMKARSISSIPKYANNSVINRFENKKSLFPAG